MKILRINDIVEIFGISRATVYRLASEPDFPRKIRLGARAVGYEESEIEHFFRERQEKRAA